MKMTHFHLHWKLYLRGINKEIESTSGLAIILVRDTSRLNQDQCLYLAGYYGQKLACFAIQKKIGICSIGELSKDSVKNAFQLDSTEAVVHSFLIGKISEAQIADPIDTGPKVRGNPEGILRSFLEERLPPYMIPKVFIQLKKLPLTANGKIDRKTLLTLASDIQIDRDYVAPSNEEEEKLVEIWSSLLNINANEISVQSNFFELGGDSLLATKVLTATKIVFNLNVPIRVFFQHTTISALGKFIRLATLNKEIKTGQKIFDVD